MLNKLRAYALTWQTPPTIGRIDLKLHTRIYHNLKVCLVVILFDWAEKCQNDITCN